MPNYRSLCAALYDEPWAILPQKLEAMSAALEMRMSGQQLSEAEIAMISGAADRPKHEAGKSVAVMPLFGTIAQHGGIGMRASGGTSTTEFGEAFKRAIADPNIGSIVIEVHSPGGQVYGTQELADLIYRSRSAGKPIIAAVNSLAASAAYWIATSAHEVTVTPGGEVGSVGVITIHRELSKAEEAMGIKTTIMRIPRKKAAGNMFEPLDDETRESLESKNTAAYDRFVKSLARNRGVTTKKVEATFGEGDTLLADDALARGMVDRIATIDEVIQGLLSSRKPGSGRSRAANENRLKLAETDFCG